MDLPEHPDYVGSYVFANSQLHQVTIPANFPLTVAMFDECKHLETITFEGTDIKVPGICFKLCKNLKNIDLRNIKTIGKGGFRDVSLLISMFCQRTFVSTIVLSQGVE